MKYVAVVTYYDPVAEEERSAFFGTRAFTTTGADTPAHTEIQDRIVNPALVRRDVFDVATTGGASRVGYGELVLRNDDGGLDWLNDVAVDGRDLIIYIAPDDAVAFPADYTELLRVTMEQPEVTQDDVAIRIRDRQVIASRNLQVNTYGGTNVLPDGTDGIVSDLKGKPKPILYGACFNISPVCVNTSKLIFQVNDGTVRDITAVYDSGALLGHGEDYTSEAQMLSTNPAAGFFRVWKAGGMFRLGSSPVGQVTADAVEGYWPKDRTTAQVFKRLLTERAGQDPSAISATDLTTLDAKQPGTIGLYISDNTSVAEALDRVAQSAGAWWACDVTGTFRLQRLEAPSSTPVITFTDADVQKGTLKRIPLNENGLPSYQVTVKCVPNYTVQTNGLVGAVSSARRARLAHPYQDGIAADITVKDTYLLAQEKVVETLIACRTVGELEAARLLALYKVKRDRFELTVATDEVTLGAIELGIVISLTYPRFGLNSGKLFRVLGYQLNPTEGTANLTIWG